MKRLPLLFAIVLVLAVALFLLFQPPTTPLRFRQTVAIGQLAEEIHTLLSNGHEPTADALAAACAHYRNAKHVTLARADASTPPPNAIGRITLLASDDEREMWYCIHNEAGFAYTASSEDIGRASADEVEAASDRMVIRYWVLWK